ncbi:MAG: uroporphyrinogen-III synthase [Micromonosporaceae bacterium]|nr:uroporphyrinogen-III synthase [Micromonosporaceae bacterium]
MPHLHRAHPRTGPIAPLAGYTVVIASDRRRHRLADLLESVGARTVGVQAARSVAKPDPAGLRAATTQCLAAPCQELVVSSALGLRAWLAAAGRWGLAERLVDRFRSARLLARDAAAADVLRALGLRDIYTTAGQTTEELLRFLLAQRPLAGCRVVVQTDRLSLPEVCAAVRRAGAEVVEVPTYTAAPPAELFSLRRLCDQVIRRQVDALALVGAPVAGQLREQADRQRRLPALVQALRTDVLCAGLGPLTAAPLAGVEPLLADRPFVEDLADALLARLPSRALTITAAGHLLELRGHAVVLDGRLVPVQAGPLAVLRALARRPGQVLSSADIRAAVPDRAGVDDHAVEMAVSRLRQALSGADLVQTIVKRGYRLAR